MLIPQSTHNATVETLARAASLVTSLLQGKLLPTIYKGPRQLIVISKSEARKRAIHSIISNFQTEARNRPEWYSPLKQSSGFGVMHLESEISLIVNRIPDSDYLYDINMCLFHLVNVILDSDDRPFNSGDFMDLFHSGYLPLCPIGNKIVVMKYIDRPGEIDSRYLGSKDELFATLAPSRKPIDRCKRWAYDLPIRSSAEWPSFLDMPVGEAVQRIMEPFAFSNPTALRPIIAELATKATHVSIDQQNLRISFMVQDDGDDIDCQVDFAPPFTGDVSGLPTDVVAIIRAYNGVKVDGVGSSTWNPYLGVQDGFDIDWSDWDISDDIADDLWVAKPLVPFKDQTLWVYHPAKIQHGFLQLMYLSDSGRLIPSLQPCAGEAFLKLMHLYLGDLNLGKHPEEP